MRYDFNPLGDPRIKVAVLDGPVDVSHPCFDGATIEIPWGMPKTAPGSPASCHGTHIASILFGQPGSPVHGLVPCCRGLILPIFRDTGEMDVSCTQRDLARAILAAIDQGAHIVAISGGEPGTPEAADAFLVEAIGRCLEDNVLVVAAAGNDGASLAHIPAAMSGVLAVGACDLNGKPLSFSNFAEVYTDHGILAPGSEIVGAVPGGGVVSRSGTSFAVPIVAGLAARMLAETVQRGDIPNPVAVGRSLIANAVGCGEYLSDPDRCLSGRINPFQSLAARNTGARSESRFATGSGGMVMSELAEELERTEAGPGGVRAASDHSPDEVGRQDSAGLKQSVLSTSDCGCGCGGKCASDCGCGGKPASAPQKVYALGQIGYDFGTEARRDSIRQYMSTNTGPSPVELIEHLQEPENIFDVERIIWTLNLDGAPIYALMPSGAYAAEGYARIFTAYINQVIGRTTEDGANKGKAKKSPSKVTLFAVPGQICGSVRLMSGETVPVLVPVARAIAEWDVEDATARFLARFEEEAKAAGEGSGLADRIAQMADDLPPFLSDFRNLITRKYRNLGIAGRDRALNFAATSAFRTFQILSEIAGLKLILDDILVTRSPSCRAGSECYDIAIRFFREADVTSALYTFQFTLDVSDTVPVSIGELSQWRERPKALLG